MHFVVPSHFPVRSPKGSLCVSMPPTRAAAKQPKKHRQKARQLQQPTCAEHGVSHLLDDALKKKKKKNKMPVWPMLNDSECGFVSLAVLFPHQSPPSASVARPLRGLWRDRQHKRRASALRAFVEEPCGSEPTAGRARTSGPAGHAGTPAAARRPGTSEQRASANAFFFLFIFSK